MKAPSAMTKSGSDAAADRSSGLGPEPLGSGSYVHATAIALGEAATLVVGPPGSGKSRLALQCLSLTVGAGWSIQPRLIADDQVIVLTGPGRSQPVVKCPEPIAGRLEVRGYGIVTLSEGPIAPARLVLVGDLDRPRDDRMPDPLPVSTICGHLMPTISLSADDPASPHRLLAALADCARNAGLSVQA
ncbi:MAG: aldolase [Pseudomonadota bacterium]